MAVTDAVMAFPGLLMIIAVVAVLGGGLTTIIIALSLRFWTTYHVHGEEKDIQPPFGIESIIAEQLTTECPQ